MSLTSILKNLHDAVLHSKIKESLRLLNNAWKTSPNSVEILKSLNPLPLFSFSHRFPTIHIPKEYEYLFRLLKQIPKAEQIDFLNRFVEYLAWSPKYVNDQINSFSSAYRELRDLKLEYLSSMEEQKSIAALFNVVELAEREGLNETLKTILQVGCNDISQVIGHYFSCTESVIRLAQDVGMSEAKNHLYLLTLYLMQSSPILKADYKKPTQTLNEILHHLVKKGGFSGYHYMIVANGLIKNKQFIDQKHYLHVVHSLETILPHLSDTLTIEKLDSMIKKIRNSRDPLNDLKISILKGKKELAFTLLRQYLKEEGVTQELTGTIAHTYTKIDDHPHDPHYVTFPTSAFELVPNLKDNEIELILAHSIEFAIDRINQHGIMSYL